MSGSSRYILYKKIARGGMAEIYLGKQIGEEGFQRLCCIKRILPYYAQDAEFIKMFRDEAHICKRLQHANIVRVEGFEAVDGSYAIIMEYVNGGDLRTLLSTCEKSNLRLPVPIALYVIAEAARGLHYAHTKIDEVSGKRLEIVHRDISPQNILISFEGEIKVTDFGIADADDKSTDTKPGIVKGKYSYMSPEQITAGRVDARTDIFALSIVLWEMLAMKRLFQGDNEVATIQLVRDCIIADDITILNNKVDQELKEILEKGLAKDVNLRYSDAADFEKALRLYLAKHYGTFTVADLSRFLKKTMHDRLTESTDIIRNLLSEKIDTVSTQTNSTNKGQEVEFLSSHEAKSFKVKNTSEQAISNLSPIKTQNHQNFAQDFKKSAQFEGTSYRTKYNNNLTNRSKSSNNKQKRQKKQSLFWPLLLILVLVMCFFWLIKNRNSSAQPAILILDTTPSVVKITIDDKPIWGKYVETPIKKAVPNGRHVITINREGFSEETFVFDAKENMIINKDGIVLKQIEQMAPVRIGLDSTTLKEVKITLDDGVLSEIVRADSFLNIKNITFGKPHKLFVDTVAPYRSPTFVCNFIPRSQNWRDPYLVVINPENKICSYPLH